MGASVYKVEVDFLLPIGGTQTIKEKSRDILKAYKSYAAYKKALGTYSSNGSQITAVRAYTDGILKGEVTHGN